MKLNDFNYHLPDELIAYYPTPERSASRLLCLNRASAAVQHGHFYDLIDFVRPEDLLVFNNTRVLRARLFGKKATGGQVEILVERVLSSHEVLAHVRASKTPKPDSLIQLSEDIHVRVLQREGDLFHLNFETPKPVLTVLEEIGHIPLPPYIDRDDDIQDQSRYQTVYAKVDGSVAAPTAGLHFDEALLKKLKDKGVNMAYVTLHVGAGTFQPVRVENITEHKMHAELIDVSDDVCDQVKKARARGGRVIAVGTTTVRCLETASQSGEIQPYRGETSIFIYPGYSFHCVDAMITNFHLPESSLLMLVSAFAGHELMRKTYQTAIEQAYRFFSYGDAMLIE